MKKRTIATVVGATAILLSTVASPAANAAKSRECADGGTGWNGKRGVTEIATGDYDNDGRDEFAINRESGSGYYIIDDAKNCFHTLYEGRGKVGALAFGNMDGEPGDELAVGFRSSRVHDVLLHAFAGKDRLPQTEFVSSGNSGVADLDFGDANGDGTDELAVAWKGSKGRRFNVFDRIAENHFEMMMPSSTHGFPKGVEASAVAFGNVDGGRADELAVGRKNSRDISYQILDDAGAKFKPLLTRRATRSPEKRTVHALAFGNPDGDQYEELAIGWGKDQPYQVINDRKAKFGPLPTVKTNVRAYSLDFGDTDGDGADEIVVAGKRTGPRKNRVNYIIADGSEPLFTDGWNMNHTATATFGNIDNGRAQELIIGRTGRGRPRFKGMRYQVRGDEDHGFQLLPFQED